MDGVEPTWRKSTRSGSSGNCVEVGDAARVVVVRDTKDREGVSLSFTSDTWLKFVAGVK
jgi:hypothetical protein